MAPIGGILASVTPKHRSEIKLDDKVRRQEENHVRVAGVVTPSIKDQQLRVVMTRPDASTATASVVTDGNGRFSAAFELIAKGKKPLARGRKKDGIYAFQAHIIHATQLAPSDSNIVWYRAGETDKEQRDNAAVNRRSKS